MSEYSETNRTEKKEVVLPDVKLSIREPEGDKHFMVTFDTKDKDASMVFRYAVNTVLRKHDLRPFHQIQGEGDDLLGFNAYEVWKDDVHRQDLEDLFPEINEAARQYLEDLANLGN